MPEMCRLLLPLPRLRTIRCFDPREKARKAPAEPVKANGVTVEYELPKKALEALSEGDRSKAIDQVQMERNISREEAREMVAAFILSQPSLQATMRLKESRAETQWGLMRWLILFQAIAVAIGYFLFFRDQW